MLNCLVDVMPHFPKRRMNGLQLCLVAESNSPPSTDRKSKGMNVDGLFRMAGLTGHWAQQREMLGISS